MFKIRSLLMLLLATMASASAFAQQITGRGHLEASGQGTLFATPLLSETEQADYRAKIRAAGDPSEKERIRAAHYELMKARARERGHVLPENRPTTVGETGGAFGPRLINEEERDAQRTRTRSVGSVGHQPATEAPKPSPRREAVAETARPVPPPPASGERREGGTTASPGVTAITPASSSIKPTTPPAGAVALPGIDSIFGPQLMSEEEKASFRARLRSAKSDAERQSIRAERDAQMRARAKENGVTLPP